MKLFWGTNITVDKSNEKMDGDELIVAEISDELSQALNDNADECVNIMQANGWRRHLPLWIGEGISALAMLFSLFRAVDLFVEDDMSPDQIYAQKPWLLYIFGIGAVILLVLGIWERKKAKEVEEGPEMEHLTRQSDKLMYEAYAALGVPRDAVDVDILMTEYVVQDGKIIPKASDRLLEGMMDNSETKAFTQEGRLYLADCHQKWAISLDSITGIRVINKKFYIPAWNKEEAYNKGEYKVYKMKENDEGEIHFKFYYALAFTYGDEEYALYFPPYELPAIQRLTGCTVME